MSYEAGTSCPASQAVLRRWDDRRTDALASPRPGAGLRAYAYKYSLFYGSSGRRLVGYDNEPGKGDHRHYEDVEESYRFTTPEQLIRDFLADVRRIRRQQG
ncbi:MAG TPA: DUF6516 family protein [Stellaceae bacterium]|nr:DUF6516 family protein [Stellaceae bacterium]